MSELRSGVLYAAAAYLTWGLAPLYWKLLRAIPALQLLAHRILWCALLLALYLLLRRRGAELGAVLRSGRALASLLASTVCIGLNWFLFIWAVNHDHVLDVSLGYFITPLVSVLLGVAFLGERLNRLQVLSVGVAAAGVSVLAVGHGQLPWISLVLATSFGLYGLLRKTVAAGPETGLLVEALLLAPFMLFALVRADVAGSGAFGRIDLATDLLLAAAGAVTALPLVWFTHGARRLPLFALGLLQYLAPSLQFLLAVLAFGEPFALPQLAAFLCIWTALALFTADARRRWRRRRQARLAAPATPPLAPR